MQNIHPPVHIVWSTDQVDLSDPFQRKWYIQQVLANGRAEDIQTLDLDEIVSILGEITLPEDIRKLWDFYCEMQHAEG